MIPVFLAAFASPAAPGALPADPAVARVRAHLVLVGHGGRTPAGWSVSWLGTGFVLDSRCHVATARHILEGAGPGLVVRLASPQAADFGVTLPAQVVWRHPDRDLAVLDASAGPGPGSCPLGELAGLELRAEPAGPELTGAEIFVAGYPALEGEPPREVPIVRRGAVASAELTWESQPMLLLDLTGVPGFSGAPVVLEATGEVIGIVFGPGRTARQYDLEWATPLDREDRKQALRALR